MPTFLENLRLRNIFDPSGSPPVNNDPNTIGGLSIPRDDEFTSFPVNNLVGTQPLQKVSNFNQNHPMEDAFFQHVNNMPERNHPGLIRQILGNIAKVAGPGLSDEIMYSGYNRKMRDWGVKDKALHEAASVERMGNANDTRDLLNEINYNYKNADLERKKSEFDVTSKQKDEQIGISKQNAETASKRAEAAMLALQGGTLHSDRDGNMFVLTKSGEVRDIDKKAFSEEEKQNLIKENRLEVINAQGEQAKQLVQARHNARLSEIGASGNEQRTTNNARPARTGTSANRPLTPAAEATAKKVRVGRFKNSFPELAKFVDDKGNITPVKEGVSVFGAKFGGNNLTTEQRQKIVDYIENGVEPEGGFGTTNSPSSSKTDVAKSSQFKAPTQAKAPADLPPIEKRTKGMRYKWPNGNVGEWDGTKWMPIEVVVK